MPTMTTGVALARLLEAYGVRHIFGIPGVHNVEMYRGLWQTKIRHVSPRHEQGAGFMADGYARVTGEPGVAFVITGPGVTNVATAIGQAFGDSIPLLVISSVNRRHELGFGKGYLHEMPNQRNLTAGLTIFSHTLLRPKELPTVLAAAFAMFRSARPRPVHIEIPIDVGEEKSEWADDAFIPFTSTKPAPSPDALDEAAALLAGAKRTLILCGGGAAGAAKDITALAERISAPVQMTTNGRGILPPGHPLTADFGIVYDDGRKLADEADVVLALGTEMGETDYDFWSSGPFAPKPKLIRVDLDPRQIAIGPRPALTLIGDSGLAARALLNRLKALPGNPDTVWAKALIEKTAKLMLRTREPEDPFYDRMLAEVRDALGDPILIGDSTKPVYRGMLNYRGPSPRSFFTAATGFGTLGWALPAAIGAKLALPKRPVIAMLGDGGVQFTLPELLSAREAEAGIAVVIWNNDGYREIHDFMVQKEIPPIAVDVAPPKFKEIAAGMGIGYLRPNTLEQMIAALKSHGANTKVPLLVEAGPWMVA